MEGCHSPVLPIFAQRIEERDGELAKLSWGVRTIRAFMLLSYG